MADWLSWVATVATIGGALLTASNLGARITGSGFIVFLVGSLCWIAVSLDNGQQALLWTNVVLTFLNMFGIWRWLGRQASIEQGAKSAVRASEATPGEALFPVSLLLRAPVFAGGRQVGTCVDAMAGERSGRLGYVVVTDGGVAGVGERMRRVTWSSARIEDSRLILALDPAGYESLPEMAKDEWPGR